MNRSIFFKEIVTRIWCCLVAIGLFSSCSTPSRNGAIREERYSSPIRVACVGDSITYGYGFKNRERESYPAQLTAMLGTKWEVGNFGVNGATLLKQGTRPYLDQQAFRDALSFKPNIVIIKLGTNDTKPENWGTHRAEFISDYLELIGHFSALESRPRIYLCLPVPIFRNRGNTPDPNTALIEIIAEIKKVAQKAKLPVIDLYTPFESQPELFPDGVHPDVHAAGLIATNVYRKLLHSAISQ